MAIATPIRSTCSSGDTALNDLSAPQAEPSRDCPLCPRLVAFREAARLREPAWHNSPVPSFGTSGARLLVVGLAPGLRGANRTGRPFTGDYAGDLLYATLRRFGFSHGEFQARPDDGLTLVDCLLTNAVRCVPPENKPTPQEIGTCRPFLVATLSALPRLVAIVALGRIAHESVLRTLGARVAAHPFGHGAEHRVAGFSLFDSYHCSRYNTNTGRLTAPMFESVFAAVRARIDEA
jgi:uracil-DNA glycosylase